MNYTKQQEDELREKYGDKFVILRRQEEMLNVWKFKRWMEIVKPEILATEKILCDHEWKEAGTADLILKIKEGLYPVNGAKPLKIPGGIYITDHKTGKSPGDDSGLQLAPYLVMFEKETGLTLAGGIILHYQAMTKAGIPGLATLLTGREELMEDYKDFRHVAALWERKNRNAAPRLLEFPSLISLKALT